MRLLVLGGTVFLGRHLVEAALARDAGVRPWTELPLWLTPESAGILVVDLRRALGDGLSFRSVEETIGDTLAWTGSRRGEIRKENGS